MAEKNGILLQMPAQPLTLTLLSLIVPEAENTVTKSFKN